MSPGDNRYPYVGSGRSPRADYRRERIEDQVAGRRLVKEAEREKAIEEGKPLRRVSLSRVLAALRHRDA